MHEIVQVGLKRGDVLGGKYVVRECIGIGGMGDVFLADQPALERTVAIKVPHTAPDSPRLPAHQLRDEAIAASHIHSPHCVPVIDFGEMPDGMPYLVMEHVPGRPLGQLVAEQPIPLTRVADLFAQVLSALAAIHAAGMVHADVKSDNFLVDSDDGRDRVKVIDFGLARPVGARWNLTSEDGAALVVGTPEYMAPEVARGEPPSPASDLYSAGIILYELLTGTTPFGGGSPSAILVRHTAQDAMPPSQRAPERAIPPEIDAVVLRALDKRPAARFPDAATFAGVLQAAVQASRAAQPRPARAHSHRRARPDLGSSEPALGPRSHRAARLDAGTPEPANGRFRRGRLARGSGCGPRRAATSTQVLRRAIGAALVQGDIAQIANGYLELARALCGASQHAVAARELQEGIDILTSSSMVDARRAVHRLAVVLAALHQGAGNDRLARSVAAIADDSPTLTCAVS